MKRRLLSTLTLALFGLAVHAQTPFLESINDVADARNSLIALTHANVHLGPDQVRNDVTVLIKDGRILDVKQGRASLQGAVVYDLHGAHVYPGFIHMDSGVGLPEPPPRAPFNFFGAEVLNNTQPGARNVNEAIKASQNAASAYNADAKANAELRQAGFTTALVHHRDGIARGTGALVILLDEDNQSALLVPEATAHFAFDKGSSKQLYPISLMGGMALLRQTFLDARWYAQQKQFTDLDLAALNAAQALPKIMHARGPAQYRLAAKLGQEFDTAFIVRSNGDDYMDLPLVKSTGQSLIVPLNSIEAPRIKDALDAWDIELEDLMSWEMAPLNPVYLQNAGVRFALLPADGAKGNKSFLKDLRKAVKNGLDKHTALAALTTVPADMLGRKDIGHLRAGAQASFVISSGELFDADSEILETWVAGQRHVFKPHTPFTAGEYTLSINDEAIKLKLTTGPGGPKLKPLDAEDKRQFKLHLDGDIAAIEIKDKKDSRRLTGLVNGETWNALPGGEDWTLQRTGEVSDSGDSPDADAMDAAAAADEPSSLPTVPRPFSAYGLSQTQRPDSVLFRNATVWTNGDDGVLGKTDVYIKNGKINRIGNGLSVNAELTIDASDMHLTPGIIDEHSHIALYSVNDVATNSGMVRMADVVNPHDTNIYRNLAGGVTAAQLLHGSANPVGGQSALIKLRWGGSADDLLIDGADGFIKFALGENVKRSRSPASVRYPQSRMGVEQVYRDAFSQALNYRKTWQDYDNLSRSNKRNTAPPRRDLVMDTMLEILDGKRFITCHSYVQSEINMLMHVADDFNFNVNTFTHILEGYKVADKMQQHGAGGSTFADWWAYKWEVNYAIPYNAALMHQAGVVTAINSDSAEMSRRLNQEAAKTVKYGDLTPQEALKTVTLNPAKLLHLDDRMGRIAVGMDADVVLWTDEPLSIYAQVDKTLIDGVVYYDRSQQDALQQRIKAERERLIERVMSQSGGGGGGGSSPFAARVRETLHCDSLNGHGTLFDHLNTGE